MRILHVIPFLWSGAGQVITSLCESQAAHRKVAIVTTGRSGDLLDWPSYRARLARHGISHTSIDFFHRDAETFWNGVEQLRRFVLQWRPDIVHTHAGVPACAAAATRRSGVEFALVNHVYSWGQERPSWMDDMDLAGHRQADVVICSADAYHARLLRGGVPANRIVKLRWGLAPSTVEVSTRKRALLNLKGPRIGFVGRIEPRKGQLDLVRAFALVRRQMPSATLDLIGPVADPNYAARVRREIDRHQLHGAIHLPGHVPNVPALLSGWDLCVSLSRDEGQGLAVLEAMALGVPVVARPVAGIEDYFRPGIYGTAVRSSERQHVADVVLKTLRDPLRRTTMARHGRAYVRRRFSWRRTVAALERIYAQVTKVH